MAEQKYGTIRLRENGENLHPISKKQLETVASTTFQRKDCGEGGIRTLGTTLRSYDGLVTPYGVIDSASFKNHSDKMSKR